jgi:hypothetical protein
MPNPQLKRIANGRPLGPVWWHPVHFQQPEPYAPRCRPLSSNYKGFPNFASNSHPGSIAQQLTQEYAVSFQSRFKPVPVLAGC